MPDKLVLGVVSFDRYGKLDAVPTCRWVRRQRGILKRLARLSEAYMRDIEAIVDNVPVNVEKSVLLLEGISLGNEKAQGMIVDRGEDRFAGGLYSGAAPTLSRCQRPSERC